MHLTRFRQEGRKTPKKDQTVPLRAFYSDMIDYQQSSDRVTAFTTDSDVCANQLHKWCQYVCRYKANVDVLDLCPKKQKAHL